MIKLGVHFAHYQEKNLKRFYLIGYRDNEDFSYLSHDICESSFLTEFSKEVDSIKKIRGIQFNPQLVIISRALSNNALEGCIPVKKYIAFQNRKKQSRVY